MEHSWWAFTAGFGAGAVTQALLIVFAVLAYKWQLYQHIGG